MTPASSTADVRLMAFNANESVLLGELYSDLGGHARVQGLQSMSRGRNDCTALHCSVAEQATLRRYGCAAHNGTSQLAVHSFWHHLRLLVQLMRATTLLPHDSGPEGPGAGYHR